MIQRLPFARLVLPLLTGLLLALALVPTARSADAPAAAGKPTGSTPPAAPSAAQARPNVLWLTTEDIGPQLGCYGDAYADTPNLDAFAKRSLRYLNAWSNAPVCAAARTTIITGVYPTATGGEHHRSMSNPPPELRMFPQLLRDAGYYCTNSAKEDYNLVKPGQVWDESSQKAHWRNRPAGKPFFAVFNHLGTHESQIRIRPHTWVHDVAKAPVPAYMPDTVEVRQDWAQYYDNITVMDRWFAGMLKDLAADGLADDTIVFFYGDHGSGMPRSKRTPCNSGLRVPLLVHVPAKWQKQYGPADYAPGATTDRLASFVDLAPTLLGIAGAERPAWMQGEAFFGPAAGKPRDYLFGFRGRMDERTDCVRSVRDGRYVYVRNFLPHLPAGQHNAYMFVTPTTKVWKQFYDEGKLKAPQTYFWEPKPSEELYDLTADKDEVVNLADRPEHKADIERFRAELHRWILATRDVGMLPEGEMQARAKGSSPYAVGRDPAYPLERILTTAELASDRKADPAGDELAARLKDADSGVRYWAATGFVVRGEKVSTAKRGLLTAALKDRSPNVRIVAAEALGTTGDDADVKAALLVLLADADVTKSGIWVSVAALGGIDRLGVRAMPIKAAVAALPSWSPDTFNSMRIDALQILKQIDKTLGIEAKREPPPQAANRRGNGRGNNAAGKPATPAEE